MMNLPIPLSVSSRLRRVVVATVLSLVCGIPRLLLAQGATLEITPGGSAPAGSTITVKWSGPNGPGDYITVVRRGAKPNEYLSYQQTSSGRTPVNPVSLVLPAEPGAYEIRYVLGGIRGVLASVPYDVVGVVATIAGPVSVAPGASFELSWSGPNNGGDWVTIVPVGAEPRASGSYVDARNGRADTRTGSRVATLRAPAQPGRYELRYVQQGRVVIGTRTIEVAAGAAATSGAAAAGGAAGAGASAGAGVASTAGAVSTAGAASGTGATAGAGGAAGAAAGAGASASAGAAAGARTSAGATAAGGAAIQATGGGATAPGSTDSKIAAGAAGAAAGGGAAGAIGGGGAAAAGTIDNRPAATTAAGAAAGAGAAGGASGAGGGGAAAATTTGSQTLATPTNTGVVNARPNQTPRAGQTGQTAIIDPAKTTCLVLADVVAMWDNFLANVSAFYAKRLAAASSAAERTQLEKERADALASASTAKSKSVAEVTKLLEKTNCAPGQPVLDAINALSDSFAMTVPAATPVAAGR